MKLLVIAPFNYPVPPFGGYGGTQRAIHDIVKRLALSDEVCLYAPFGSESLPQLRLLTYPGKNQRHCQRAVINHLKEEKYDLVYSHLDSPEFARLILKHAPKLVVAGHYYYDPFRLKAFNRLNIWLQAQSQTQADYCRQFMPNVFVAKQSVAIEDIEPSLCSLKEADPKRIRLPVLQTLKKSSQDYLLIISRISSNKGQATAAKLASAVDMPLIIAGAPIVKYEGDFDYFKNELKPLIDERKVFYYGNADEADKLELMKFAKATILPTGFENPNWHEAFGRVVNESLACGTPAVAHNWDAMPEQIEHGKTGFLFKTLAEAEAYLRQIDDINRQDCIDATRRHLNAERFVKDLRREFAKLIKN